MAHVTVEWTANLQGDFEVMPFLRLIAAALRDQADGVFPVGGIRVRGLRLCDYVIADDRGTDDAFINVEVKIGAGRPAELRQRIFDELFSLMQAHLGDLFERRPTALSMYVAETEGWKHNSIHRRVQAQRA